MHVVVAAVTWSSLKTQLLTSHDVRAESEGFKGLISICFVRPSVPSETVVWLTFCLWAFLYHACLNLDSLTFWFTQCYCCLSRDGAGGLVQWATDSICPAVEV